MEPIKNILIPTDFSPAAWKAVQIGALIAKDHDATLTMMHVFPSQSHLDSKESEQDQKMLCEVKKELDSFCKDLIDLYKVKIQSQVLTGEIEEEISNFQNKSSFELVILGVNSANHNDNLGSHVEKIIRRSGVPVMVIPNKISA